MGKVLGGGLLILLLWLGWAMGVGATEESPLSGAIEFHVHTAPDVVPRLWDDQQLVEAAEAAGLRAVVLKNHVLPTGDRALNWLKRGCSGFRYLGAWFSMKPWGVLTRKRCG